jgi:hypothetical protein
MKTRDVVKAVASMMSVGALVLAPAAWGGECKQVHGVLVERPSTEGCLNPARSCFLGEVNANHGLLGTTHFQGLEGRAAPPGSPGWSSYNGFFHYTLQGGTLVMRETGLTGLGFVTAHQQILEGTGKFAGATGYFFVSGLWVDGNTRIATEVSGEICLP